VLRANLPASAGIWDHVTRAVRRDDLEAFQLMDPTTRYPDLPSHLKRYDDEHFTDKYNRLAWDKPSRAITAHLARDGYWYIHPKQHRTLTIREAARIQSFPDWFRFAGFASSALRQIGEAVAPLVAEGLGNAILEALSARDRKETNLTFVSRGNFPRPKLEAWFEKDPVNNSSAPWRRTGSLWLVLLGEVLMADLPVRARRLFWKNLETAWQTPRQYLKDRNRTYKARAIGRHDMVETLDKLAALLSKQKTVTPGELLFLGPMKVKLAFSLCGYAFDRPNVRSVVRVARRYFGQASADDDMPSSQILIGMLIGEDKHGEAFAAALELGDRMCTAAQPACLLCPLNSDCGYALASVAAKNRRGTRRPAMAAAELERVGRVSGGSLI
jgi:DNA (cytosine-5)-methyltransferase 1